MHQNNIGTLRFLGALFVLYGHGYSLCAGKHALDPISALLVPFSPFHKALPGIGVMLFFVLSGYLITASFSKNNDVIDYLVARALRIFPALIAAVLFCTLVVGLHVTTLSVGDYLSHPATSRFLVFNSILVKGISFNLPGVFSGLPWSNGVNGSLWTLPIELSMYGLVVLVGIMGAFANRAILNVLAVVLILAFISNPEDFPLLVSPGHAYLGLSFLLGAICYINKSVIVYRFTGVVVLLAAGAATYKTPFYDVIALIGFTYIVFYIGLNQLIRLPRLDKYGDFSYGLYLYAYPLQQLSIYYLGAESPLLINSVAFLFAMVLAIFSWHLIENSAMKRRARVTLFLKAVAQTIRVKTPW